MRLNIDWKNDVGAPAAVTVLDIATKNAGTVTFGTQTFTYNEIAAYAVALGSYAAYGMGKGGDFVKNMGIASLPWAANLLYPRVKALLNIQGRPMASAVRRIAAPMASAASVSRYPAPAYAGEFNGVRLD